MTNKTLIFKKDNKIKWECIKSTLIQRVNELIGIANEDFQVVISPYSKRSKNALRAYWVMIDAIVEWDKFNNGLKKYYFHDQFMEEAGLFKQIDMLVWWEIKYRKELETGYRSVLCYPEECYLERENEDGSDHIITLGRRYRVVTRSLSDKGDITREEMERLLLTVIKFGAEHDIPNCYIKDIEFENILKYYDK